MPNNVDWLRVKEVIVPSILKMLECETSLDEESGLNIVRLPASKSKVIDDWKKDVDKYRESGLELKEAPLGTHENMNSPGKITLYSENIGRCFWVCINDLLTNRHKISKEDLRGLCEAAVFQVFTHEQFHHYCDVISHITGHRESNSLSNGVNLDEEALAVAWSWHEVQRSLPAADELSPKLFQASLTWWYDNIQAMGYRDWKKYSHKHFFMDGLVPHLIAPCVNNTLSGNRVNLGHWLYKMMENSEWCADAVDYCQADRKGSAPFPIDRKKSIQHTNLRECLEEMGVLNACTTIPVAVKGDLILSGKGLGSLTDIGKMLKEVDGCICLHDNPIQSDILGLLQISNLKKVCLDNKALQKIINKYLPQGDILDCVDELHDAGFSKYARL
jgi:hypothetical protein